MCIRDRADAPHLSGLKVLVVAANATSRGLLEESLQDWRMAALAVGDSEAALTAVAEARMAKSPFDLLVIDASVDGFSLARRLRERAAEKLPAVLLLASTDRQGDSLKVRQLGSAAAVVKPVARPELREALLKALGRLEAVEGEGARPDGVEAPVRGWKVLLAEDNLVNQRLAVRLLEKWGCSVTVAGDGWQALAALRKETFDLALMDVQMPGMDGFEVTRRIREEEACDGGHLPILALTAHAMSGDRERCLAAGMDDYLSKPLNAQALLGKLDRLLSEPVARGV